MRWDMTTAMQEFLSIKKKIIMRYIGTLDADAVSYNESTGRFIYEEMQLSVIEHDTIHYRIEHMIQSTYSSLIQGIPLSFRHHMDIAFNPEIYRLLYDMYLKKIHKMTTKLICGGNTYYVYVHGE